MAFCVHLKENSFPVERSLRFAPEEIREGILGHETFFPMPSLRTRMRTRVVWLELSLILLALTFAELGEVLRELRTDVVFDWFVSLAPLIWINVSILVLYAFFRLYFSPSVVHPTTERARAGAIPFLVPNFHILRTGANSFRRAWGIASVAYAVAYALLQGIFVVDLSGSPQPVSAVLEGASASAPGFAWPPTTPFGAHPPPSSVAPAVALSAPPAPVFALPSQVATKSPRAVKALQRDGGR